jgi:ferric-dicitrate binding protein FerR (iron transport regulator)
MSEQVKEYLQQLATKVLAGKASEEEQLFLEEYFNVFDKESGIENEITEAELNNLRQVILERIHNHIKERRTSQRLVFAGWRRLAVAALLLLIAGVAVILLTSKEHQRNIAQIPRQGKEILPGGNKATLTLGDGSTILLDNMKADSLVKQDGILVTKSSDGLLVYSVKSEGGAADAVAYNTITTPRGGQYQVVLPDGTRAWLNAASSIYFPTRFEQKQRSVAITGEVYFEVAHNAAQPFVVTVDETRIQVLGTHFNVMAYPNEDALKTTLAEGSVRITKAGSSAVLKPGQQLQANDRQFKVVENIDVAAELAWKDGLFNFKNAGIEEVMKQVERWYNVNVQYAGNIPAKQFTGMIPRASTLSELMEMLSFYDDVKCVVHGNTITIQSEQ